jgi:phosphate:Na+ symporter
MNIFGVLTMAGGLALFLYGMNVMGDSLAKLSGGKLEQILEKLTSKRIMAVLLGMAVTAVIQSSSATTVMVVGFVNSKTHIIRFILSSKKTLPLCFI